MGHRSISSITSSASKQCLDSSQFEAQVDKDYAQAQREGITSRPVLDIDGTRLIGALSIDRYRQTLDAAR